jgi:luciferase family oxidoreductase group 1
MPAEPVELQRPVTRTLELSILDVSPVHAGITPADALANTVDLARRAERLGYHRFWLAEHHNTEAIASSVPEVMIAQVANATTTLRVGSGGVMLPNHSPLKVVETFRVLETLHPGRIDLGIGRAPGTDGETMFALQRDRRQPVPDDFLQQLAELLAYFEDGFPEGHPFGRLARLPGAPGTAEVWLLGTSHESAVWAAEWGLPYSVADFINPGGSAAALLYRERFDPVPRRDHPEVSVAVAAICAETGEEAQRLASSWRMAITLAGRGQFGPVPAVDTALAFLAGEVGADTTGGRRTVVGSPETVRLGLERIAAEYDADELVILTMTHDHAARRRSYELLAEAFGLEPASAREPEPASERH